MSFRSWTGFTYPSQAGSVGIRGLPGDKGATGAAGPTGTVENLNISSGTTTLEYADLGTWSTNLPPQGPPTPHTKDGIIHWQRLGNVVTGSGFLPELDIQSSGFGIISFPAPVLPENNFFGIRRCSGIADFKGMPLPVYSSSSTKELQIYFDATEAFLLGKMPFTFSYTLI